MTKRPREEGMALVTVLLLVAVAAAVLGIMMSGEDAALQRATRMADAARARAIAAAGEASAIVALRRDMTAAPESDDLTEPWANIAEKGAPIPGGRFALAIADAQGKLNLNPLVRGDPVTRLRLAVLCSILRLPPGSAERIAAFFQAAGKLIDLAQLSAIGLAPEEIERLAHVVTALPADTPVNVNTAPEPVLALLLNDPVAAHGLVARRGRTGKLSRDDLILERVRLPPGAGFTSAFFWVRTRATVHGTTQQLTSLLMRRKAMGGASEVVAVGRWRGNTAPIGTPSLPPETR